MNKKDLKKLLIEIGGIKHFLNIVSSSKEDGTYKGIIVWWYDEKLYHHPDLFVVSGGDYVATKTAIIPFDLLCDECVGREKRATKRVRKLYAAYCTKGVEGLLEILEKKNAALRRYLWEEVIEEES